MNVNECQSPRAFSRRGFIFVEGLSDLWVPDSVLAITSRSDSNLEQLLV